MKKLKLNKTTKNNLITYGIVILAYIIVEAMLAGGQISSLMKGLLVPLCVYVILAVSLNLVVGILGELSLGHAGFMCVGAFSSAFFSKCTAGMMPDGFLSGTADWSCYCGSVRTDYWNPGTATER